ncbi:hypothetical protein Nepgr_011631 [Nepenthes gracilis]|uniref:Uncharacterized protein n=1 Tax=Nepenthes gracilis TaxID=150966 RepID=A0AAD3SFH5_NEPGR|nr:hypothetical protein Nepgr_011631 [Nepenthes gracilis]
MDYLLHSWLHSSKQRLTLHKFLYNLYDFPLILWWLVLVKAGGAESSFLQDIVDLD